MPFKKEGGTHRRHRIDVGQADRDFSQPPKNHHPRSSVVSHSTCPHQHAPPRSYAIFVVSLWSPTQVLEDRKWDIGTADSSITAKPEGTTSTAISVADRTQQRITPGPYRPGQA
jgi:hypothetical protein